MIYKPVYRQSLISLPLRDKNPRYWRNPGCPDTVFPMACKLLFFRIQINDQDCQMTQTRSMRYSLDPPVEGSFPGRESFLIEDINFNGLKLISSVSPPIGEETRLFIRSENGITELPVNILESEACFPDERLKHHFAGGMVFSIHCRIRELDESTRDSIIRILESHYSNLHRGLDS